MKNRVYLFFKKIKLYIKYYSLFDNVRLSKNQVIYIVNKDLRNAGLVDRFKTIVAAYFIAKQQGFEFKILHTKPFNLVDYIVPNKIDWTIDENDLNYGIKRSRILTYTSKIPKLSRKINQYHVYVGRDLIRNYYPEPERFDIWHSLFNELFVPSKKLIMLLAAQSIKENEYYAVHLRFVNALEHFEEGYNNSLSIDKRELLISRCIQHILLLKEQNHGIPFLIFSDSDIFLERIKNNKNEGIVVLDGEIGHITFRGEENNVVLKTFLDFYMISRAYKVYSLLSPEMYNSMFAAYAAHAGGKCFERIELKE